MIMYYFTYFVFISKYRWMVLSKWLTYPVKWSLEEYYNLRVCIRYKLFMQRMGWNIEKFKSNNTINMDSWEYKNFKRTFNKSVLWCVFSFQTGFQANVGDTKFVVFSLFIPALFMGLLMFWLITTRL